MKKTLIAGLVVVLSSAIGMTAAGAAGTTNGNAGCVAQVNTVEGPPGQSIEAIKLYLSPVPGRSGLDRRPRRPHELRAPPMSRRSYLRFIIGAVALLVVGLALGKDRGGEESLANTTSAILLTIGFLGVVVFSALELVGRARSRS